MTLAVGCTGTLTQNKMTVSQVWVDRRVQQADYLKQ
jgi:magnesium-transporting ATPase (P-type)